MNVTLKMWMTLTDKLREEIIESQRGQATFVRWKLLLIAAIGAASLGVLPGKSLSAGSMSLLALLPFVCWYVDMLCFHSGVRILMIARYFRMNDEPGDEFQSVRGYEEYCKKNRQEFTLEGIAVRAVSVGVSAVVGLLGVGIGLGLSGLPVPYPESSSALERLPLAGVLGISGAVGMAMCIVSYARNRDRVRALDDAEAAIEGRDVMVGVAQLRLPIKIEKPASRVTPAERSR